MKKILTIIAGAFAGVALMVSAQVSNVSQPNFFKYVGTSIVPTNASSTIGTTTRAVAGGYFNNLTVSGTCTGCSGSGVSTTTIAGITSNSFIFATTTTGSVFSFATSSNTITFNFPVNPTFNTITTALTGSSFAGTTTLVNLNVTGTSTHATSTITALTVSGKSTLANASSTALTVSGNTVLATTTMNGDFTLNGVIRPRVVGYTASTTITIDLNTTAQGTATSTLSHATTTFANPTGTTYDGLTFGLRLKATTTLALAWGTSFASSTALSLPTQIASGTTRYMFEYRPESAKYEYIGEIGVFQN